MFAVCHGSAEGHHQARTDCAGRSDRDLLAQYGAHCQLEAIDRARQAHAFGARKSRCQQGLIGQGIGIEVQIENALGLINIDAIAAASPRVEAIIFGPADFMASINMKSLVVGEQPPGYDVGDAYHYILMRILMAARAFDKHAIDGPYLAIKDVEGYRRVAGRSAALGFDGKWVLHPGQLDAANEVFSPRQDDYDQAELILDAYDYATSAAGGAKGAVMLGDEMIDEASRKMALVVAAKGRAAGMARTKSFTAPSSSDSTAGA